MRIVTMQWMHKLHDSQQLCEAYGNHTTFGQHFPTERQAGLMITSLGSIAVPTTAWRTNDLSKHEMVLGKHMNETLRGDKDKNFKNSFVKAQGKVHPLNLHAWLEMDDELQAMKAEIDASVANHERDEGVVQSVQEQVFGKTETAVASASSGETVADSEVDPETAAKAAVVASCVAKAAANRGTIFKIQQFAFGKSKDEKVKMLQGELASLAQKPEFKKHHIVLPMDVNEDVEGPTGWYKSPQLSQDFKNGFVAAIEVLDSGIFLVVACGKRAGTRDALRQLYKDQKTSYPKIDMKESYAIHATPTSGRSRGTFTGATVEPLLVVCVDDLYKLKKKPSLDGKTTTFINCFKDCEKPKIRALPQLTAIAKSQLLFHVKEIDCRTLGEDGCVVKGGVVSEGLAMPVSNAKASSNKGKKDADDLEPAAKKTEKFSKH